MIDVPCPECGKVVSFWKNDEWKACSCGNKVFAEEGQDIGDEQRQDSHDDPAIVKAEIKTNPSEEGIGAPAKQLPPNGAGNQIAGSPTLKNDGEKLAISKKPANEKLASEDAVKVTIRMPAKLKASIRKECQQIKQSQQQFIISAINEKFERIAAETTTEE